MKAGESRETGARLSYGRRMRLAAAMESAYPQNSLPCFRRIDGSICRRNIFHPSTPTDAWSQHRQESIFAFANWASVLKTIRHKMDRWSGMDFLGGEAGKGKEGRGRPYSSGAECRSLAADTINERLQCTILFFPCQLHLQLSIYGEFVMRGKGKTQKGQAQERVGWVETHVFFLSSMTE